MVPDYEDLSREGVRAAGDQYLLNGADDRRGRRTYAGPARSIAHRQDTGGSQVQAHDRRVLARIGWFAPSAWKMHIEASTCQRKMFQLQNFVSQAFVGQTSAVIARVLPSGDGIAHAGVIPTAGAHKT